MQNHTLRDSLTDIMAWITTQVQSPIAHNACSLLTRENINVTSNEKMSVSRKINVYSLFPKSKRCDGKTLSELHIHYKSLQKRVYNHAGCIQYWKNFTVALKMINVVDKKQTYDSVMTRKENASKECNYISMFLTWWVLMSILCLVMHVLCVYALKLLSDLFWDEVWLFLVKTSWQPCHLHNGHRVIKCAKKGGRDKRSISYFANQSLPV